MKICIIFNGDFYVTDFFDYKYLKDVLNDYNIKRKNIKSWWKEQKKGKSECLKNTH